MKERICVVCGKVFYTETMMGRYPLMCSTECRKKRHNQQVNESAVRRGVKKPAYVKGSKNPPQELRCVICGISFWRVLFRSQGIPRACSPACRGILAQETIAKRGMPDNH